MTLTDSQYAAISCLYHAFNEAFCSLAPHLRQAFYDRLYSGR